MLHISRKSLREILRAGIGRLATWLSHPKYGVRAGATYDQTVLDVCQHICRSVSDAVDKATPCRRDGGGTKAGASGARMVLSPKRRRYMFTISTWARDNSLVTRIACYSWCVKASGIGSKLRQI
jgi:hypothetical protein